MGKIRDIFFKQQTELNQAVQVLYDIGEQSAIDYSAKENRADKVTYAGIGQTKYSSGMPPTIYDNPIAAVRAYPVVYGAITAISDAISGLGIKVYRVEGGQSTEEPNHPFYMMFANPNPQQGSFEFLEELVQSLEACGNCFISKEKIGGGFEYYLLNPKYVALIPDGKIKVKEYRYYINGQVTKYKPEEIIHIKYIDLDDPYYGMPPLNTASDILTFEKNRLKFANQFFVNGAIPVGVLETDNVLGETVLKKLRSEWSAIHQGVNNSHKIALLQGGVTYKPISSPIKDLDFTGLKKLSKEDILTIFKMPESILGSQEGTAGKEGKDAITAFWRQCIIPRIKRIESALNRGLKIEVFGNGQFRFEFNLKDVAALQDDKTEMSDYLQKMVSSSIMTPNEARSVIGLPPRTGEEYADQLLVSNSFFGNQLMPVDAAAAGVGGAGTNQEKPAAKPAKAGDKAPAKPAAEAAPAASEKPAKAPKKEYDEFELKEAQVKRDHLLASTGQIRFTKQYLGAAYGFLSEDIELVNEAAAADRLTKEFRNFVKARDERDEKTKAELMANLSGLEEKLISCVEEVKEDLTYRIDGTIEVIKALDVREVVKGIQSNLKESQSEVKQLTSKVNDNTQTMREVIAANSSDAMEHMVEAVKSMAEAMPKTIEINNPPVDINMTVDMKTGTTKKKVVFQRDEDGNAVSADLEETCE